MADAQDIHGTVFKNGSAILLARVVGAAGAVVTQGDIASLKYSIYLLDDDDPDCQTPVPGHTDVALSVSAVLFNILQTDALWTQDTGGYNFKHALDVAAHPAFAVAGRHYRIVYELAPAAGQVILVRFRVHVV
jgi:hypothetical protein